MGRRDNGDGCVYQISEDKWGARIYLGKKEDGKPLVKQFSGKNEAIVKKKLREFKKEKEKFSSANFSKVTLREYIGNWLYNYKYNNLKVSSFDRLESTIENQIIPNIGFLQFLEINQDDLQNLINTLYRKKQLSYSSIKKVYNALSGCFDHAMTLPPI